MQGVSVSACQFDLESVTIFSQPAERNESSAVSSNVLGATLLSIPSRLIQTLGLERVAITKVSSNIGPGEANIFSAVRLTIQGRSCTMDVMEVPDGVPILIGQLPLEHLDFVVDLRSHSLIGNPAHGGEHI